MTSNEQVEIAPNENGVPPPAMLGAGIVFDPQSGISEEEQREILAKINGIAEKNRRSLAADSGERVGGFTAQKSGGRFPIAVNAAAVVLLAGGFALLSAFQGRTDAQVREGTVVYNSTERALIEEIRKETASRIAAKENEIALIVSRLAGVDEELRELHSSNQELNAEQLAAEEQLMSLQEEYRSSLTILQDERSHILEEARAREANLRSQLEARIRELTAASEQSRSMLEQSDEALGAARNELEKLGGEREKIAAIEAQMGGHFAVVHDQIQKNQLAAAGETLRSMRVFLETAAFQDLRSFQARKELYAQAINALEAVIEEAMKNQAAPDAPSDAAAEAALADLRTKNAQLEQTVAGLTRTIEAVSSQGSGLTGRLSELERESADLQTRTAEKDRAIAALESEKTSLAQTVAARENAVKELQAKNTEQETEITNLNNELSRIRQALQALSQ
jgi:chromosome segregation ATPase